MANIAGTFTSIRKIHQVYWSVLAPWRNRAVVSVGIGSLAGLFELATLAVLTPIMGLDLGWNKTGFAQKYLNVFAPEELLGNPIVQFAVLILTASLSIAVRWFAARRFINLRFEVVMGLRRDLLDRLLVMPWERYHLVSGGTIGNSLHHAVWQIGEGVEQYLQAVTSTLIVLVLLVFAILIAPNLAVLTIVYVACIAGVSFFLARQSQAENAKAVDAADTSAVVSHQVFENLKYVRVSGIKDWARDFLGLTYKDVHAGHAKITRINELHHYGIELGGVVLIGLLLLTFRLSGTIAFGTFVMFLGLCYRSLPRIQVMQSARFAANARLPWVDWWGGLNQLIGAPVFEKPASHFFQPDNSMEIVFDKVTYAYPNPNGTGLFSPVVSNFSFVLKPGHILALAGESGAGKSTMMDLLLGLISPVSGRILIGGVPLANLDHEHWRRSVGFLPQEPLLFSGSVLTNVAFADHTPNRDKVERCLKAAQAWDFVCNMPAGLDTQIGERGGRLSGGEKQRLALARALYRDPKLLLLDEPTSALDEANVTKFRDVLATLKNKITIVMITHQASMLAIADEILNVATLNRVSSNSVGGEYIGSERELNQVMPDSADNVILNDSHTDCGLAPSKESL